MSKSKIDRFIEDFGKEMEEENAAIFAGAGLSIPAGFVNWKSLLRPIIEDLELDIDKETDLVSIAQFHCNENANNRSRLTRILLEEFSDNADVTENHRILARLPVNTFWTTNYDTLIEDALKASGKRPDIKYTVNQLAHTLPKRDAVIYKMHGDIAHPGSAIITKDDYQSYANKYRPFITALSGDLVEKTFLFVGFSFTDPNLDYVLSRIRIDYGEHQRQHYCLVKKIERSSDEDEESFRYRQRKQDLFVNDLKRYNIQALELDTYDQITEILNRIEDRFRRKSVFISGAAHEYGAWGRETSEQFLSLLAGKLIKSNARIVTGVGLGVGSAVLSGALSEIYMNEKRALLDDIVMCPFPQSNVASMDLPDLWKRHRENMLSHAGIAIFVFGNKQDGKGVVNSDGMEQEFEIALNAGLSLMPVGATGFTAQDLWRKVMSDFYSFYPKDGPIKPQDFEVLGNSDEDPDKIASKLIEMVQRLRRS